MTTHLWVVRWMRKMMHDHDLSAESWAKRAGVAGTTITRFLSNSDQGAPSVRTLTKLAKSINVDFPAPQPLGERFIFVPIIDMSAVRKPSTVPSAPTGEAEVPSRFAGCHAAICDLPSGGMIGILPGDLLVFDPKDMGGDGALVLAVMSNGKGGPLRRVGDHLREEAPGAANHPEASLTVLGTIKHVQRDLSGL